MVPLVQVGVVALLLALLWAVVQWLPQLRPPWPVEDLFGVQPGLSTEAYARRVRRHGFPMLRWKDGTQVPGEAAVLAVRVRREVGDRPLQGLAPETWRGLLPCLGLDVVDRGSLTVTTHRLLYAGENGNLSLTWAECPTLSVFDRGLWVEAPGDHQRIFFRTPHARLVKTAAGALAKGEWRNGPRRQGASLADGRPARRLREKSVGQLRRRKWRSRPLHLLVRRRNLTGARGCTAGRAAAGRRTASCRVQMGSTARTATTRVSSPGTLPVRGKRGSRVSGSRRGPIRSGDGQGARGGREPSSS